MHSKFQTEQQLLMLIGPLQSEKAITNIVGNYKIIALCLYVKQGYIYVRQVAPAYNNNPELMACGMLFIYKRKSRGPRSEPWGTPQDNLPGEEYSLPTFTVKDLLVKYEINHPVVELEKPRLVILSKRIS